MSAQPQSDTLVFISTGGTIEKVYKPANGALGFDNSRLAQWLKDCRIACAYRAETLMLVDSLDMTEQERHEICAHISGLAEARIVVLHGTDTMVQTAKMMMVHRKQNQVIVFTGAMIPAAMEKTDAFFNLGFAASAAQLCPPGVYISMNGLILGADNARKNNSTLSFEPLDGTA